jgi:predicted CoA-binding protein
MRLSDSPVLSNVITSSKVVHIYGAGLNQNRPAHTAVKDLSDRGWAVAPIHPKDGGATIDGFPIRPGLDNGITPEIVVLFLAPQRARDVVRNLIIRMDKDNFPLIWFQLGAEDDEAIEALDEMGVNYVFDDCLVRYCNRHDLICSNSILPQKWCLQTASEDGDGCSIWSVYSTDSVNLDRPNKALEWVGSIDDLANSKHSIPRYIRSLAEKNEDLYSLSLRLSNT